MGLFVVYIGDEILQFYGDGQLVVFYDIFFVVRYGYLVFGFVVFGINFFKRFFYQVFCNLFGEVDIDDSLVWVEKNYYFQDECDREDCQCDF